jgi:hypothetical protein
MQALGSIGGRHRAAVLGAAVVVLAVQPSAAVAKRLSGVDGKLDSTLRSLVGDRKAHRPLPSSRRLGGVAFTPKGRVRAEIYVRGSSAAAADALRAAGMEVVARTDRGPIPIVEGWVAVAALERLAALRAVRAILPVRAMTDAGSVQSEGDATHHGPQARALGPTGAGVDVGVISDSINQVAGGIFASQSLGDLPAQVHVLSDMTGGHDEGRAMAEIIYDEAPGITRMAFAAASGAADKVRAMDALVAEGVRVIADDIIDIDSPFFQDGAVSQAVDRARDQGVAYFVSAGNRARQSYEAPSAFPPGEGVFHDFDPGPATDTVQTIKTVPPNGTLSLFLQWDEPWGHVGTDIDAELVHADGSPLAGAFNGTSDNIASGVPAESAAWFNGTGGPVDVAVRIRRSRGSGDPLLKYIVFAPTFEIAEYATDSDTINPGAAAARGSMAVAAVRALDPLGAPEAFSSRGPVTRLFDAAGARLVTPEVRQKPDLAGADGVSTTVPGFRPFYGTSAATPSAAGVAALAISANPTMPLAELRAIMTNPANTYDCLADGFPDPDCGYGFVFADAVVAQALDATPPEVTSTLSPAEPTGQNGWWTGDVTATWSATDDGSPVGARIGCGQASLVADGTEASSCEATSAGGTTSRSVTLKRDATPPDAPAFTGIDATTYEASTLPASAAVGCTSSDTTSGLASCTVSPLDASPGEHTITATATDNAGLTSTSTLTYTVDAAEPGQPAAEPGQPVAEPGQPATEPGQPATEPAGGADPIDAAGR